MGNLEGFFIFLSVIKLITVLVVVLNFIYVKENMIYYGKQPTFSEIVNNMHKGLMYLFIIEVVATLISLMYFISIQ